MRTQPLPFIGGFYADETRPFSLQDCVNWLPTAAEVEGTRTAVMAKTPPGLSPFVDTGGSLPTRNVYSAEGRLFATMGSAFYQISNTGVAIPRGTVPGVKRVRAAHNQITNGNQVMLVNGDAGFIYQTTDQSFTTITDDGFPGAVDVLFKDGYFLIIEPGRRFAANSDLADGLAWNTLDRFTSEVTPDLLVALGSTQNDLILFSESSAEFFENTGAAQQPFRSKRISMERGCASRYGVVHLDNTVFWLGNDGKFYVLDGYGARRISTRPIEQAIAGLNWAAAFAFAWEAPGRSVAYWTFPDGQTWGYDVAQPPGFQWHRRESLGLERWRVNGTAYWQNRWIAADFQRGRLWELDSDYPLEGADEMASEMTGPVIHDHQCAVQMPRLEFIFDTGQPEVEVREFAPQPDPPTISGEAPDGEAGVVYGPFAYTVTPGGAPIATVVVKSGELPEGVSLSNAGVLSGTPEHSGSFTVTLRVTDTNGLWAEHTDTFVIAIVTTLLPDPAVLPTSVSVMAFDPTSTYLAVGHYDAPYLIVYKRVGDTFTALSLPAMPSLLDRPHGLAWSPNGLHLAVAPEGASAGSPAFVLKHADDVFTLIGDLPGTPLDWTQERGIAYTADGAWLTLAFSGGLKTWARSGDTYTEATTEATSAIPATFQCLDYSGDGAWLAVGLTASPWLDVFAVDGASLGLGGQPAGVPAGFCVQPRFNADSSVLGFASQTASPYLALYAIDGDEFTALTVPVLPTTTPEAFEWSPSGRNFLVGGGGANATYVYARHDDTAALIDTLTGLTSPRAITWAPNGGHFVLGGAGLRFYRVEGD